MPIATPLTALLGIKHPVLLAPMDTLAGSRLVRAVSKAGGFGILGGGYGDRARLETETAKLRDFSGPFGIGFITWSLAKRAELLGIALAARPRAIMLSFGDPAPFAAKIRDAGARLICQVQSEDMAKQALDAGADILIAQGTEAGGHGASRTTIDIVPAIVDLAAGRVPVVAAGGIADGRGLAAMMMLAHPACCSERASTQASRPMAPTRRSGGYAGRKAAKRCAASSSTCRETMSGRRRSPDAAW